MQHLKSDNTPAAPAERLLTCPDCGLSNLTPRGLVAHRGGSRCQEMAAQSPQFPEACIDQQPAAETAPEPTYLAVLTGFAASRGEDPIIHPYDSSSWLDAQKSKTVWWFAVLFSRSMEEALGDARRMIAEGVGTVTQAGDFNGFAPGANISPIRPITPIQETEVESSAAKQPVTLDQLPAAPQPLTLAPADENTILGTQLTEQYQRAVGGIREVLVFGAMMIRLRDHLAIDSTRGVNSGGGRYTKGSGMKAWLREHAPNVAEGTAYRFMDIAEGLRKEFSLGARVDLEWLLTTPADAITDEKLRAKREQIFAFIEGKSQRQLLLAFEKGQHGAGGGHDPKKNTKKTLTPEQAEAAAIAACRTDVEEFAKRGLNLGRKYTAPNITDADRDGLVDLLRRLANEIDAYNKTPVHQRTPSTGLKLLEQTSAQPE